MLLDVGDVQTELLPCVEQDADCEVRVPDPLGVASHPPAKLSKRIIEALVHEPVDLGQQVPGLRLRWPCLQPADVSEADICVDLVAIRYDKAWNLDERLELRTRWIDTEEAGIVSFGRLVQNLQGRESPVAFNDSVSILPALLDDDQRLVPEEAVVQVGLRELFQRSLLEQET